MRCVSLVEVEDGGFSPRRASGMPTYVVISGAETISARLTRLREGMKIHDTTLHSEIILQSRGLGLNIRKFE